MAGRLGRPEFTGIAKDGEDIAQDGIGQFGIRPGGRPKMPGIAHPILHILEDIEQVSLRQPGLEEGFERGEIRPGRVAPGDV